MIRDVVRYPDRRLKLPASPIGTPGPAARRLAEDLQDTARHYPRTVGIAAPQIGAMWRMAYVDCSQHKKVSDPHPPFWLIDPRVVLADGAEVGREGCLSLPGIRADIRRPLAVRIKATDLEGNDFELYDEEIMARVWPHENDHLNGVLIIDKLSPMARIATRKAIRELELGATEG